MDERRKPTNSDARRRELTPQQAAAADLLASGRTVTDAAEAVGVARQTVSEWLNRSNTFQAEVGRRRGEVWDCAVDRLRGLLPKALDLIERELQGNSLTAAMAVLRAAGLHGVGAPTGPRTLEEVELAEQEREADRRLRAMGADLMP